MLYTSKNAQVVQTCSRLVATVSNNLYNTVSNILSNTHQQNTVSYLAALALTLFQFHPFASQWEDMNLAQQGL